MLILPLIGDGPGFIRVVLDFENLPNQMDDIPQQSSTFTVRPDSLRNRIHFCDRG